MNTTEKENPTIYIVTSGEYSDYRIEAVFTDEKLAKDYIKKIGDGGKIEKYTANEYYSKNTFYNYKVAFRNGTGFVSCCIPIDKRCENNSMKCCTAINGCRIYVCYLKAKTMDEALKIASERHATFLALNLYQEDKYINYYTKEVIE